MEMEMEMEMEMRAREDIGAGKDLTPALSPLSFSLYDSSLLSHCSSCFSYISPSPLFFRYCSSKCSDSDSPLHHSSAERHLLLLISSQHHGDTSDLRAALRLLHNFSLEDRFERIGGLMSNRQKLMSSTLNDEVLERIRDGAKAMARARRMRDGLDPETDTDCQVEAAMLCVVITNAVEVQVGRGPGVGIAVYDVAFSWINHSCSPNACYRFLLPDSAVDKSPFLIVPAGSDGVEMVASGAKSTRVATERGPRIVVRSIKTIGYGDEVFVAYTDLLQPKAMRQSELWSKYRFICSCQRCSALAPTYVDRTLQEVFAVNCDGAILNSNCGDDATRRFSIYVDDAISEYLILGNPLSCCEKLEALLSNGVSDEQFESEEEKSKRQLFLHPLHHLSLSAYTTLSSAYKTHASDLLAMHSHMGKFDLEAFDMNRTSAAYSLLLAGATHHLFLSEPSLVVSAANFWTEAGETLLKFAKSSVWKLNPGSDWTMKKLSLLSSCNDCVLVDMFKTDAGLGLASKVAFEDLSREFLRCITIIIPKVWTSLIQNSCYLKLIEDPIDFHWIKELNFTRVVSTDAYIKTGVIKEGVCICSEQEIKILFQLGLHCLLYGGYLSSSFCGQKFDLAQYVEKGRG